jgi:hypothetical protein
MMKDRRQKMRAMFWMGSGIWVQVTSTLLFSPVGNYKFTGMQGKMIQLVIEGLTQGAGSVEDP